VALHHVFRSFGLAAKLEPCGILNLLNRKFTPVLAGSSRVRCMHLLEQTTRSVRQWKLLPGFPSNNAALSAV
jgi:hypothetical protein